MDVYEIFLRGPRTIRGRSSISGTLSRVRGLYEMRDYLKKDLSMDRQWRRYRWVRGTQNRHQRDGYK